MRKSFIAAAIAMTAIGCSAATIPFTVKAPAWNKIAECTTDGGVNIRKAPSTSAPKLVYNESKIEYYDIPLVYYAYWGSKTGGSIHSVTFEGVAPVVSEQPGWVELLNEGPKRESNAWVSSKYCKVGEITPIASTGNPSSLDFRIINFNGNVEGTYAIYMYTQDMDGIANFYLGRLEDGKVVCPYILECDYAMDLNDETAPTTITKGENGYTFNLTKQGMTTVQEEYGPTDYPDVTKLPAEALNLIISQSRPMDSSVTVYLYNGQYHMVE